jgi:pilus assembly protein CpaC
MRIALKPIGWPLAAALAAASLASTAAPLAAQAAASGPVVQLSTSRGRLITLTRPISDVFVADDAVADVQVRSPTQIYVFGKKPGETTVSATTKAGTVAYSATIRVGNNFDSIGQMLGLAMPDAHIVATTLNGVVLLTGIASQPGDAAEAQQLVQAFVGDQVKVLSRIRTATPLQVNLQVRIAEVSHSFMKNIGVNLASEDSTGGFKFSLGQGSRNFAPQYAPGGPLFGGMTTATTGTSVITNATNGTTLGAAGKLLGLNLLGALDLGETDGDVTTLANPNLTALSGETASFLAGGEIPIPISTGLGAVSVDFKEYGVSLSYTPTVLADGRISLRVRPEVSQLSAQNAVTFGGTTIPGITTRRAETTVELGSGQSFMIGGLLQNDQQNSINKAPALGDVPVLGSLFRSSAYQRNETELVIVVTPYLVKPINAADVVLPTDGYKTPSEVERVFKGQLDGGVSGQQRPKPTVAPATTAGPAFGAAAPVPLAPGPDQTPASSDQKAALPAKTPDGKGKGQAPMPGFDN